MLFVSLGCFIIQVSSLYKILISISKHLTTFNV